jgi:hypothetical protein
VDNTRGGRGVASHDIKAQCGAVQKGTVSLDEAAVVTYLDGLYLPDERQRKIHGPHEEWDCVRNALAPSTFWLVDTVCHASIGLLKAMSASLSLWLTTPVIQMRG